MSVSLSVPLFLPLPSPLLHSVSFAQKRYNTSKGFGLEHINDNCFGRVNIRYSCPRIIQLVTAFFRGVNDVFRKNKRYLRVQSFAAVSCQSQKAWRQENQHLTRSPDLSLCPTRRALATNFAGYHSIHDDVITFLSEEVGNGSHCVAKSVALRVVTAVVQS